MATLKELSRMPELLSPGHRMCPGCGAPILVRLVLRAASEHGGVVAGVATGCLEVSTSIFPYTAWRCSFIHNAFENVAATISGVETAYKALKARGKVEGNFKFVAFGGDGGTYDIGLQALSGALERGHDMVYICYDNEAYMNTGIQRSSSTPFAAHTTTCPVGKVRKGKTEFPKDLTGIVAAHRIPYVAQASISHWNDLYRKLQKAFSVEGPAFLNVLTPCTRGWRFPSDETVEMARLAVETCFWPLYEVEGGRWKVTFKPRQKKPLEEWVKRQGRFRHLLQPENRHLLEQAQAEVDRRWEELLARSE
ncbi:MAG: pyruvate ferredoxin oxidoreductase [Candidatus Latescibacterota bacterium]|nr:MAG: pyruvate ferredoxin oxidoreductase [Candidatus Latescibacterota bacterium]